MNKQEYVQKLENLNLPREQFIILSGGSLLMRGLREMTADHDLCVTKGLAEQIGLYNSPKDDKGCFVPFDNVQVMDNYDDHSYDIIDGYKCESLDEILAFKRKMKRTKDIKDIEKIENYLKGATK